MILLRPALALFLAAAAVPAVAQPPLQARIEARLAKAGPGTRFGLVVTTADGKDLIAISPDDRFIPASNTKIFTTAAAYATLSALDQPDTNGGAAVRLDDDGPGAPDVVLIGRGDARLSSAADCAANCLAALADAVAARTRIVGNIVGDDTLFPDERWSPGMSWNNISSRYGTATSALTLDDNELLLVATPGTAGTPPHVALAHPYYTIENHALTVAAGEENLSIDRAPNGSVVRLTGSIPVGAAPERLRFSIDDPAHYAAWRMKALLEARGVRVTGGAVARHRPHLPIDDPATRKGTPPPRPPHAAPLAQLTPPPLGEDLTRINVESQNLHAELLLRRLGNTEGTGSIADGIAVIDAMLARAGVPRTAYDFSDGSGMSTYNRVSPRGVVTFLHWIGAQPWGAAWRDTLPVGGRSGTLSRRFKGTALEGRVFAKTGTLNATNALAGQMIAGSGRTLVFAIYANDVPGDAGATSTMDAVLEMIAAEN
ncbi:D-alanyl-D-alanine carboxypeptidase/D-alanyl-D-alanine-endopeptidase [Sphingomonas cavernae]|uniref:D-alanyl-D-alanine carboxypeptidase/D-alanyl-D-alanine-endopeptidase n=1 Tax=Sphingomonas cavernae TaxID=2320861 RepID=A0A418WL96_9SPHN|nr:D-alanyl-D-alanine carboxypeptidase/D-alanyl-D-alanine-endopeptidase [Sphingomonas cavernae]RJF90619.1 D-alanyl-D-alanine carboxypeptidase/D-alanyl-D-alanine-endopeptidase [Sphingomonas cavernae]